jgi:cyclase
MKKSKKLSCCSLAVLLIAASNTDANAQVLNPEKIPAIPFDKITIITTQITPHFYALTGSEGLDPGHPEAAGGRVGVFVGAEGIFMVDGSYAPLSEKIVDAIRRISNAPIRFLVDTHEHPDHTGGNPNFAKLGALIFSREETREDLAKPFPPTLAAAIGSAASNTNPARLPTVTFGATGTVKIYLNGETIDIVPVLAAHTNGDCMVKFEKEDVIMIGDFYRNYGYPFIDAARGGTFKGVIAAIDTLLEISGPKTKFLPGHGSVVQKADLVSYRSMILDIRAKVQKMIDEGKTWEEILAAKLTEPYDPGIPGGTTQLPAGLGTSADRFVGTMYAELKTAK